MHIRQILDAAAAAMKVITDGSGPPSMSKLSAAASESPAGRIAHADEALAFLDAHPEMQFFELIFTNLSGVPRGKRLRRHELLPVYQQGRFLPG